MLKNRSKYGIDCASCLVHYLCLPKNLENSLTSELNSIISNFKYVTKNEHVFSMGEPMQHLFAVHSGSCKDYRLDEHGEERIDNFYFPGDVIGLESIPNRKHHFSVVALEDTEFCLIPLDQLFKLMQQHEPLLKRVIHIMSYKMQNDQHISITTNANQRIVNFLLNIYYRLSERGQHENLVLPMSQLDVSHFLGMAHETVNRVFHKLHKDNIINLTGKKIALGNIECLKNLASEPFFRGQL